MIEPAFGRGAGAQAKTVGKARKDFDLGRGALRADGFNAPAHYAFVCDVVPVTHTGISGRLVAVDFPQPGILHDDGSRLRIRLFTEGCRAVAAQPRRHPCPGRAAPEGVAAGVYFQFLRMGKDKGNGPCQIFAGGLCAGAVDERKSVVLLAGKFQCMRKAVLHGPHIRKRTACVADGKFCAGITLEVE